MASTLSTLPSSLPAQPTVAQTAVGQPVRPCKRDRQRDIALRELIAIGRKLFEGNWRALLLDLDRLAQHKYREVRTHSRTIQALLIKVNVIRLAYITHTDILCNEPPAVTIPAENEPQAQRWEEIADNCLFETLVRDTALTSNIDTVAYVTIMRRNGRTCLTVLDSLEVFQVGELGPDGQPEIIDRRWVIKVKAPGSNKEKCYLRVERHSAPNGAGQIENFAYEVESAFAYDIPDDKQAIELSAIMGPDAPPRVQPTGVDRPLIFRFANRTLRGMPLPEITKYDVDLIDQLAATTSQIARIAAKHADPKMRVPSGIADPKTGTVDAEKLEAFEDPNKEGEYLTWDSKMGEVLNLLTNVINWLLMVLEISPSLVGIKAGAAPESFEKLFLEATNTMKRANAVASAWRPLWERVITAALRFDSSTQIATFGAGGYDVAPVAVVMRPGLPRTRGDIVNEFGAMKQYGLIDELSALEELHGPEKAQEIFERLEEQRKRTTESYIGAPLFGAPAAPQPAAPAAPDDIEDPAAGIDPVTGEPAEVAPAVVTTERVLNGAQIQAATLIVRNVVDGVMPRDAGIGQLITLFNLTNEQAEAIMGSAGKSFVPKLVGVGEVA